MGESPEPGSHIGLLNPSWSQGALSERAASGPNLCASTARSASGPYLVLLANISGLTACFGREPGNGYFHQVLRYSS